MNSIILIIEELLVNHLNYFEKIFDKRESNIN